ncbi:39S ribosomal protein L16, mitochondrial [Manacus vitellinus]|uniref:39S ribosomal protein L16, mitochondrial n=1 Tax=Manacus vitellinus TaxID=328815 RepID=UPI00115DB692|nr:39S ribosomal protein L16, mitochondrial [Manacus vitellinus]
MGELGAAGATRLLREPVIPPHIPDLSPPIPAYPPLSRALAVSPQALGGGYLHWGHFEMIRLTIGRHIDPKSMFAVWRVPAPYKPVTRKSLGHRMGGGKGPIDHYVTAVRSGRLIVEVGGHCHFGQVRPFLAQVAQKLPFPAVPVSRESLQEMRREEEEKRLNNQNPWTFERIITSNMLGMRKYLSPYDLRLQGRYWGKFFLRHRV